MAVTAQFYGRFFTALLNKELDFNSDSIYASLHTSAYTPDLAGHDYYNDLTNEVSGTGYTAGGAAVTTASMTFTACDSWAVARANSTAYAAGALVRPATGNGRLYRAVQAGTSGGSVPTWPTEVGATVVDGSVTWACVASVGVIVMDGDDVTWAASTITARYAALRDNTPGAAATKPLIALVDFGADVSSTAGPFQIVWDAGGIAQLTV